MPQQVENAREMIRDMYDVLSAKAGQGRDAFRANREGGAHRGGTVCVCVWGGGHPAQV